MKTSLVYPATQKHIDKYSTQEMFIVEETPEDYKNITLPFIESEQFSIQVRVSEPIYTKRQRQRRVNAVMTLATQSHWSP